MLKVGFFLRDDAVPRTEYWQQVLTHLGSHAADADGDADLLIPCEDTAIETNWPRYGNPASAYIRGKRHDLSENGGVVDYVRRIAGAAAQRPGQQFLYLNMHPFFRVPLILRRPNIIVADASLAGFERALNPNTISMPALPVIAAASPPVGPRPILASFQGVNSHPVRQAMAKIADQKSIVVNFVERTRHVGRIDAINARTDEQYEQLLAQSVFAFVPRGDALFSYRLLEVMSFGCLPIILSDGWVLPFDRTLPWDDFAIRVHTEAIQHLPGVLALLMPEEIAARQSKMNAAYRSHLADLGKLVTTMLSEAETLCRDAPSP